MCIYYPMPKVLKQTLRKLGECILEAGKPLAASAYEGFKGYLGKLRGMRNENGTHSYKNY